MPMWGVFSDEHGGVDFIGTRDSLREFGRKILGGFSGDLPLDAAPPNDLTEGWHPVEAIRVVSTDDSTDLIVLRREDRVVVISGERSELARLVGERVLDLAEMPNRMSEDSVPTHLHIEPADDPEHRCYSPQSTVGIAFNLAPEDHAPS